MVSRPSTMRAFMGFRAQLLRFPEERVSVVALCNLASTTPDRLARDVADIVLEDRVPESEKRAEGSGAAPSATPPADTLEVVAVVEPSAQELRAYEGRYASEEPAATYTLAVDEGVLSLQRGRLEPVALEATARHEFQVDGLRLVFDVPDRGGPASLTAHAGRVRNIRFERIDE